MDFPPKAVWDAWSDDQKQAHVTAMKKVWDTWSEDQKLAHLLSFGEGLPETQRAEHAVITKAGFYAKTNEERMTYLVRLAAWQERYRGTATFDADQTDDMLRITMRKQRGN